MIAFILCILPTVLEIIDDARGELKKGKVRDFILAVIFYSGIALFNWQVFEIHPLKSIALMLGVRVMFFDYVVQYVLIKRGVITGHWFFYQGKTAKWDRVISYLNPWVVLAVKVIVFAGALAWSMV